jgi:peptidoglycan/LPS O-acetylase OafA/YrhL
MLNKINNFDFLRLLFASMVIITHSYALTGLPEMDIVSQFTDAKSSLSYIGVRGFFTISGFLIYTSLMRTNGIGSFLWKRFVRIWPALTVLLLLTVFILGPLFTSLSASDYFSANGTFSYFYLNLVLLAGIRFDLPGVFTTNLYPGSVNGSLWTLPYEVMLYILLSSFYLVKKLNHNYILVPLWLILFSIKAQHVALHGVFISNAIVQDIFVDLALYFVAGSILAKNISLLDHLYVKMVVFAASVLLFVVFAGSDVFTLFQYLSIPLAAISFAYLPVPYIHKAGMFGDCSYGIYIYGFIVQQSLCFLTNNEIGLYSMMFFAWIISIALGLLSWHLIEKRAMQFKDLNRLFPVKLTRYNEPA